MAARKKKTVNASKSRASTAKRSAAASKSNDFWKVDFNINSLFWLVIGLAVIATAVLTYNTNQQTNAIYDSIDQINNETENSIPKQKTSTPAN